MNSKMFFTVSKSLKPVVGLTLLALIAGAYPSPSLAQRSNEVLLAQAQPPAAPLAQPEVDYILGGGDRIRITVFEIPEYTGEYQIPPGGALYLPLIGGVSVRGLTQEQAAETITAKYSRYLKRPIVTVSLISPRPVNVVVSGEVNRPGSYSAGLIAGGGDNPGVQYPTVLGALTLAEGVTLAADIRNVQLRRSQGLGPQQVVNLDLTQLIQTGTLPQDITLRDGDTIFVPTTTNINLAEVRQLATASFAASPTRPRTVTVVGEVNRPGSYVVVGGSSTTQDSNPEGGGNGGGGNGGGLPTVTRAIQLAGGITSLADISTIQVRRLTKAGAEQGINVNLAQLIRNGDTNQDTLVQDGDTIFIPTATDLNPAEATQVANANFSPATIQVSVVGEVRNPGIVNIPPNTPLNQALLSAGGFNNSRARRRSVELVRLNPDGTVTKRDVPINLAQGISEQNNPTLRDNDIIVVNRNGIARVGDTLGTALAPVTGVFSIFRILGL